MQTMKTLQTTWTNNNPITWRPSEIVSTLENADYVIESEVENFKSIAVFAIIGVVTCFTLPVVAVIALLF